MGMYLPGQAPQFTFNFVQTPFAWPSVSTINAGEVVLTQAYGGLTKLEYAAIAIAAGLAQGCTEQLAHNDRHQSDLADVAAGILADVSVHMAQAVLHRCREAEPQLHGAASAGPANPKTAGPSG